jgi:hypothetical protein
MWYLLLLDFGLLEVENSRFFVEELIAVEWVFVVE